METHTFASFMWVRKILLVSHKVAVSAALSIGLLVVF